MNKKRVALALAAALGVSTLTVTLGEVGGQVRIAHAQNARLSTEDAKKLDGIVVKYLDTEINLTTSGDAELTFKNVSKDNVKGVKVVSQFEHRIFEERNGIDSQSSSSISSGTWDANTGKFKLNGKFDQPGIYTGKIEIEFKDGTKEVYTVTVRKTPSDSITFNANVGVGTIEIENIVLSNGVGSTNYSITDVTMKSKNGQNVTPKSSNGGKFVFSALDLSDGGVLSEGEVFEVQFKYGDGKEYTSTGYVTLVKQTNPEIKEVFATNGIGANALDTVLKSSFGTHFGDSSVTPTVSKNSTGGQAVANGKTVFTFDQTYGGTNNEFVGGAQITATNSGDSVKISVNGTANVYQGVATSDNFINNVTISYGNPTSLKSGLIGNYYAEVNGNSGVYFEALKGLTPTMTVQDVNTASNAWVSFNSGVNTFQTIPTTVTVSQIELDAGLIVDKLNHGYDSVAVTFDVDSASDVASINSVNSAIDAGTAVKNFSNPVNNGKAVKASVVVVADTLDGVASQVKFEKTSSSEGNVTIIGGKDLVGANTDINTVRLNVSGASTSIYGTQSGKDLVFKVQFNGQVPSEFNWTLQVGSQNKLTGKVDATQGALEIANLTKAGVTNSGTENVNDQFRVDAAFNSVVPTTSNTVVSVDGTGSDRVTFDKFTSGEHALSVKVGTGSKYQGTYSAGIWVTAQPMALKITKTESNTAGRVDLTIDGTFFNTDDYKNVTGAKIQYREKVGANETPKAWTNANVTFTVGENSDISTDAQKDKTITKSVTGLTANKEYEFQVIYDYKEGNNTIAVTSNIATQKVSNSSSSNNTITGSGSTTTGTSTGSTTINVTTSNSTLSGTSAFVKLPSGFRYDSNKTPVATTFKYKDNDGKIVTETKEQFSNVEVKFNGDNVEVYGLVPGKNYDEIIVDYTDNNGRTRSIVLRNIQTTATAEVDKYLANVYQVVFNRPADEAGYHFHLNNLKNKKVSLREFLLNMLSEKEFIEKYVSTEEKIEALYSAIVGRSSDEAGKKFWVEEYNKALKVYGSEATTLKAIADRMVNENELKELADKMGVQW